MTRIILLYLEAVGGVSTIRICRGKFGRVGASGAQGRLIRNEQQIRAAEAALHCVRRVARQSGLLRQRLQCLSDVAHDPEVIRQFDRLAVGFVEDRVVLHLIRKK